MDHMQAAKDAAFETHGRELSYTVEQLIEVAVEAALEAQGKNYVAFLLPEKMGGGIYGVAQCGSLGENTRLLDFADSNNIKYMTGSLHEPDELIRLAESSEMFR